MRKGVIQKYLADLAYPVVRFLRYGKGYIAELCNRSRNAEDERKDKLDAILILGQALS